MLLDIISEFFMYSNGTVMVPSTDNPLINKDLQEYINSS